MLKRPVFAGAHHVAVEPVTARDADMSRRVTVTRDQVTPRDTLIAERWKLLDRLAEIEAEIGPMSPAERKRRARKKSP